MPKLKVDPKDRIIDLNFAKIGIKDYFQSGKQKSIRFFSPGEPTIAFNEMVELTEYAKMLGGNNTIIEIETNGFFKENVAEWLEDNVNIIWISSDGQPHIQNRQRPTLDGNKSSDIVLSNIKRFAMNPKIQFGVRATISDDNLDKQVELIEFFKSIGVKYVSAAPTYRSKINKNVTKTPLMAFAKGFVPAFNRAITLGMYYLNLLMVNFDEEVNIYCQSSTPTPRLTPDGFVSCCDWAALGPKYIPNGVLHDLIIGRYNSEKRLIEYFPEKILNIQKRNAIFLSENDCKGCQVIKHCAGGCVGKIASVTDDIYKMNPDWCDAVRYLYDNIKVERPFPILNP
jgi:radical SAM protein with 4Fe4S-binding SPASM domain